MASRRIRSTSERHRSMCATAATVLRSYCCTDTRGPRRRGIESPHSSSSAASRSEPLAAGCRVAPRRARLTLSCGISGLIWPMDRSVAGE